MSDSEYEIPNDDDVSPDDIRPEADLSGADLSEANLRSADLSRARLFDADLSGADLGGADLPGADLFDTDLSGADLRGADLSGAILAETNFDSTVLSRGTEIGSPNDRIQELCAESDGVSKEQQYDITARANHELRQAYSGNGLTGRARRARVRERRARRKEAFAEDGWRGTVAWFGSLLSRVFTGYGVQLLPVIGVMSLLYLVSALVYWGFGGMDWDYSLYYSVVTFTTAPPQTPPAGVSSVVASIETFAGTAAIVFLGYVLGTRERV